MGRKKKRKTSVPARSEAFIAGGLRFLKGPFALRQFRNRISVLSTIGRYLFHCPAVKALHLVTTGAAAILEDDKGERFWRVVYLRTPIEKPTWAPPLTAFSFKGQRYTFRQHIARRYYIHQLKKIRREDRWAFRLSVTDNLVKGKGLDKLK